MKETDLIGNMNKYGKIEGRIPLTPANNMG